jgi:hypothetical protein
MDRFIRRENIKHYRALLREQKSDSERKRIQDLLDEELRKQREAGDEVDCSSGTLGSRPVMD